MACKLAGKQCRERYQNHLAPDLNRGPFSCEEDAALMQAVRDIGTRWIEIAKRLPGRSENACKNRYNSTLRRQANALKAVMRKKTAMHDLSKVSVSLAKQSLGLGGGPGSSSMACQEIDDSATNDGVERIVREGDATAFGVSDLDEAHEGPPHARNRTRRTRHRESPSHAFYSTAEPNYRHPPRSRNRRYQIEPGEQACSAAEDAFPPLGAQVRVSRSLSADAPCILVGGFDEDVDVMEDSPREHSNSSLLDNAYPDYERSPVSNNDNRDCYGDGVAVSSPEPRQKLAGTFSTPQPADGETIRAAASTAQRSSYSQFTALTPQAELSIMSAPTTAARDVHQDRDADASRDSFSIVLDANIRPKRPRTVFEASLVDSSKVRPTGALACSSPLNIVAEERAAPTSKAVITCSANRAFGSGSFTPQPAARPLADMGAASAPTRLTNLGLAPHLSLDRPTTAKRPRILDEFATVPDSARRTSFVFTDTGMELDRDDAPLNPFHLTEDSSNVSPDMPLATPSLAPAAAETLSALRTNVALDALSPLNRAVSNASTSMGGIAFSLAGNLPAVNPRPMVSLIGVGGAASAPLELDSAEALLCMFAGKQPAGSEVSTSGALETTRAPTPAGEPFSPGSSGSLALAGLGTSPIRKPVGQAFPLTT
jgi:hypothetical protein